MPGGGGRNWPIGGMPCEGEQRGVKGCIKRVSKKHALGETS